MPSVGVKRCVSVELGADDGEAAYDVEAATNSSGNVRKDLSEWQERHAFLVLSKSKVSISYVFPVTLCKIHLGSRVVSHIMFFRFWQFEPKLLL